jgi:polyphosphate glucokinase
VAFPAVVQHGIALTAANVDHRWIGMDVAATVSEATGTPTAVLNDADAAGLAEVRYGAGAGVAGVVLTLTLGTGIGSGLFTEGVLVPNTEFGHLEIDGHDAETRASEMARERDGLSWAEWAARLERYLRRVDALLWPDLIVLGGGAAKKSDKWLSLLQVRPTLAVATLRNAAGIVGAAMAPVAELARPSGLQFIANPVRRTPGARDIPEQSPGRATGRPRCALPHRLVRGRS